MTTAPERIVYVAVYDESGHVKCVPEDEPRVDAAVSLWVDSGRTRDTILYLTALDGARYCVLASHVTSWMLSAPQDRERSAGIELALKEERKSFGLLDDD